MHFIFFDDSDRNRAIYSYLFNFIECSDFIEYSIDEMALLIEI